MFKPVAIFLFLLSTILFGCNGSLNSHQSEPPEIDKPEPPKVDGPLKTWTENILLWDESYETPDLADFIFGNKIEVSQFDETLKDLANKLVKGPLAQPIWLKEKPEAEFYDASSFGTDANVLEKTETFIGQKVVLPKGAQIIVMGDFHGSIHSLIRNLWRLLASGFIDSNFKIVKENSFLVFTGDFVDRGRYSIECLYTLFRLKLANFDEVFLLRGNHENLMISDQYGLKTELQIKYGNQVSGRLFKDITNFYRFLPVVLLAEIAEQQPGILHFSHGGFSYNVNEKKLAHSPIKLLKSTATFEKLSEKEALGYMWSDFHQLDETIASDRGLSASDGVAILGKDAIAHYGEQILQETKKPLVSIIRGHQDLEFGLKMFFNEMPSEEKLKELQAKNKKYQSGPWHWQDVVKSADQQEARISGLRMSDYRPVYTFTSAAEGRGLPFDSYGIIKTERSPKDYRLEVHEIPLSGRKLERSYVSISKALSGFDQISPLWSEKGPGLFQW